MKSKTTTEPEAIPPLPPATCSAAARERLETAEAALMKAATEFAYQWGRDQTVHPKMYWLELHLENWSKLARAALAYSECVEPPNDGTQRGRDDDAPPATETQSRPSLK